MRGNYQQVIGRVRDPIARPAGHLECLRASEVHSVRTGEFHWFHGLPDVQPWTRPHRESGARQDSEDARHGTSASGDPYRSLAEYGPAWLGNLADDAILEGSLMDGFVPGAEAVRAVVVSIRPLWVRGKPAGNITLNAAGQPQRVLASYQPRSTLLLVSG